MASGARSPPSEEPPDGRPISLAARLRPPPPRRRFPAPSRGRPGGRAARTPRAAGPAAAPTAPPESPRSLRLSDSVGPRSERRLVAHLHLALGLWRGGHPQVPVPATGPSREHAHPPLHARSGRGRPHLHPRSGEGAAHLKQAAPATGGRAQPPPTFPAIPTPRFEPVELRGALQEVVLQLGRLRDFFPFSHTTSNLALTTCRRLLASVTLIPRIKDFIEYCGSDYTPSEVQRMELAILDKLHWDLCIGTPLDFLNIFHALVVVGWPHVVELLPQRNPSLHVASLTKQPQHCMAGHQLLQFKGSTLALVIITLELERLMPDWCAPISDLLKKAQVGTEQSVHCRILVKLQLTSV